MIGKLAVWLMAALMFAGAAGAQQRAWVQIEAQPTLTEAEDRAGAYAAAFPNVVGYQLGSRWYGIALGPYDRAGAEAALRSLRGQNLIPGDSFVTDGSNFRQPFWPVAGAAPPAPVPEAAEASPETAPEVAPEVAQTPEAIQGPPPEPEETVADARRSEALLTAEERQDLQRALQWEGFYAAAIDGAFGPGTRNSMAAWQTAMGAEPTGVLTTRQREVLVANWQADLAEYGFQTISEPQAGIEITLPMGLVRFDHYEPPFVHYTDANGSGLRVILISQPGDQSTLYGLYDILQTLTIVPPEGDRTRGERSFEINAASATVASFSHAQLSQGLIKGYILIWEPAASDRAARVLAQMKASFRTVGSLALDPGMVAMDASVRQGLLAGLEVRRPRFSRSGFYADAGGHVVTTQEAVESCGRITLDGLTEADVLGVDSASGVALLAPRTPLAPPAIGSLQIAPDRVGAEVAVAGYAYEGTLPAPVITYGTLDDVKGLNGEPGLKRLGIATLPGDAGGPVIDGTGAVLGMLLPRATDGARILPEGVEFAASAATIASLLSANGLSPIEATAQGALAPEDLTRKAMGMTVLVGCWD